MRLVAKGYSQIAGLDFEKTFAPIVRIESICALFALTVQKDLEIIHLDCMNTFLYGHSDLELYVSQPEGFTDKRYLEKVLKLNKSLYRIKQAPRIWYLLLCSVICSLGFVSLESNISIYCHNKHGIIFAVFIDDILIFGPTKNHCNSVYYALQKHFMVRNLGFPTTFLGLAVTRSSFSITINQTGYIDRIL